MDIVPVIDLLHGQVVRGVRGQRAQYRPVVSALCGSAEPLAVAERLCEHCATDTLYVADLDALQARPPQHALLAELLRARPRLRLWLDAGFGGVDALERLFAALGAEATRRVTPVLASESLASRAELTRCLALAPEALLSLDRRGDGALDAADLWNAPELWPSQLIVMTLDRVGSGAGPDLATLDGVRARAPQATLIGAGGIRGEADLAAAAAAGAQAWLVASALHDGRLGARGMQASTSTSGADCVACGPRGHTVSSHLPAAPCRTADANASTMAHALREP
jgi:phosphoribosylformimino-5-aminoimidazole carboxamide ribotide isomerase